MSVRWSPFTKGVATVGLLLFGAWLLNRFHALLAPLVTTALVAYVLNLPVGLLVRRTGLSRPLATVVVYLVLILLLVLLPALFGPRLVAQVAALEIDLQAIQQTMERLAAQPITILRLQIEPQKLLDQVMGGLGSLLSPVAASAFVVVANAAEAVGWLIFVLVVSFLLVKDLHYFGRLIGERIPASLEPDFYRLSLELGQIWNAFLRGRLAVSVVLALLLSIALAVVGMRSALVLGVIAGVLTLIPSIGSILAALPAVLLALVRGSSYLPLSNFWFAVLVTGLYVAVFQFESLYLQPVIIGRRVRLHPAVVIVGTVGGALVAGILGMLLAAPVIASARVLLGYTLRKLMDQEPFEPPQVSPQTVGVQWRGLIRGRPIEAVLFDLDGTLVETDDRWVERIAHRLQPIERFLPDQDAKRLARRLVMWLDGWSGGFLALLDRLKLDGVAQRLARRLQIVENHTEGWQPQLVAGVESLLRQLNGRYRLGVVSTRSEAEVRALLAQHGLDQEVQVIVGSDTTERIKPHPQPVLWAAQRLGVAPEHTVLVGDTRVDVRAAKAAGALAIGVLCGFGEQHDLADADLILESTADLAQWL